MSTARDNENIQASGSFKNVVEINSILQNCRVMIAATYTCLSYTLFDMKLYLKYENKW